MTLTATADAAVSYADFAADAGKDALPEEFVDDMMEDILEHDDDVLYLADLELDPDRDPFGWNIVDYIDWDAYDGEGNVD